MPQKPKKLSQFWQQLKRRRVIHVIMVYASTAFVIIELVNYLTEPLNLPERLSIIVVTVLVVGFPLAIIFSWRYALSSEGIEKTKPLSEIQEGKKTSIPRAWKIANYVSFVVIIGLVVLNVMGGDKQLRPGEIQDLLILPFENYTVDDTSASEITSELNVDAIIESNVLSLGDSICIQVRVISAFPEKETLWIADYKEEKSQILNLYNRLAKQIANDLKIQLSADEDIEQLKKMNLPLPEE